MFNMTHNSKSALECVYGIISIAYLQSSFVCGAFMCSFKWLARWFGSYLLPRSRSPASE